MQIPHSLQLASESGKKFMKRDMTPAGLQQQPFMQLCDEQLAWDDTWQANKFSRKIEKNDLHWGGGGQNVKVLWLRPEQKVPYCPAD